MTSTYYVSLNGEIISSAAPVVDVSNRAFRYGDGLFESIRVINGIPCFLENHMSRLLSGMEALRLEKPAGFNLAFLTEHLSKLIKRNGIEEGGRIRLSMFRDSDGFYAPHGNKSGYLIEAQPYPSNFFEFPDGGLDVDIYSEIPKPVNKLSVYKTSNALNYIMASLYAKEKGLDDVLLVSDKGSILEATSSNLFIVSNGVLYTPTLEDGCIGGTMRMNIINIAIANNIKVYECTLTPQNLLAADEVFLTSSVSGIRWVSSYKSKRYYNNTARKLLDLINDTVKEMQVQSPPSSSRDLRENVSESHISSPSS